MILVISIIIFSAPPLYLSARVPFSSAIWKFGFWFPLVRQPMLQSLEALPWQEYSSDQIREMMGPPLSKEETDPEGIAMGEMYYDVGFGGDVIISTGWSSDSNIASVTIPSQFPFIWWNGSLIHLHRDLETGRRLVRGSDPRDHAGSTAP